VLPDNAERLTSVHQITKQTRGMNLAMSTCIFRTAAMCHLAMSGCILNVKQKKFGIFNILVIKGINYSVSMSLCRL